MIKYPSNKNLILSSCLNLPVCKQKHFITHRVSKFFKIRAERSVRFASAEMSGVVIKLNEDEEEEEDDVAGLLARHRDQDDDDDGVDSSDDRRGHKAHRKKPKSSMKTPFTVVRSSSWVQLLLHTMALCCVFFAIGLTKSLVDIPVPDQLVYEPSQKEVSAAVGYVIGFLLGGVLLSRLSQSFLVLLTMCVLSSMLFVVPWTTSNWANVTVYGVIGGTLAVLMIEGNVLCFDFWGKKSGRYIQALHFCLSLGLLTGPLLVDPLSRTRVPEIVQKALPQGTSKLPVGSSVIPMSFDPPHIINKRQAQDQIIAELFNSAPLDLLETTTPQPVKTPKPKPIFTDARKLDNSRDWENVKIAKPPKEEVEAKQHTTTSTTQAESEKDPILLMLEESPVIPTKSDPVALEIRREVKGLQQDMQENDRLLQWIQSSQDATTLTSDRNLNKSVVASTSDPVLVILKDINNQKLEDEKTTGPPNKDDKDHFLEWLKSPSDNSNPPSDKIVTRVQRSVKEKKDETVHMRPHHQSHHHQIHSPLLSGSMTHDDNFGKDRHSDSSSEKVHRRNRRQAVGISHTGFGGAEPPLYNRPRIPRPHNRGQQPPPMWPVPRTHSGMMPEFQQSPYIDYPDNLQSDYINFDQKSETFPPPPEKVEKAIETIKDYLKNPDSVEDLPINSPVLVTTNPPTTTTSTTTTSTTTTTTTIKTTTTPSKTTSTTKSSTSKASIQSSIGLYDFTVAPMPTEKKRTNHRKKPLLSFDNDTETDVTLGAVFNNYGVAQENIGFILDSSYCILVTILLLLCSCYRPREPRTRLAMAQSKSDSGDRIFKATLIVLIFFFNLLHWGMFITLRRLLPNIQAVSSPNQNAERIFEGIFTATRFLAIFSSGIFRPSTSLFGSLFLLFLGSLILVFIQQLAAGAIWAGIILQAIGLSTLLPTSLQWAESYIFMYPHVVSGVCWGLSLGELMIPHLLIMFSAEAQAWLGLAMLGATFLCLGLFLSVFLIARKHQSHAGRPQASGYELASQNDMNEDLLEDDEDFEVSEATLQFSNDGGREANA